MKWFETTQWFKKAQFTPENSGNLSSVESTNRSFKPVKLHQLLNVCNRHRRVL